MYRDEFEDGKWYTLKDELGVGFYRCKFFKGPELVRVDSTKYYEMSSFFLTDQKGYLGIKADTGRKLFDINYIYSLYDYTEDWVCRLEEEHGENDNPRVIKLVMDDGSYMESEEGKKKLAEIKKLFEGHEYTCADDSDAIDTLLKLGTISKDSQD